MSYAKNETSYGGALLRTRRGRCTARPVSTTQSMHVVLRASAEAGTEPFPRGSVAYLVRAILQEFAARHCVKIWGVAVNRNHVHVHASFSSKKAYQSFIRASTGAIAMAVGRVSRWHKSKARFWQLRPFSRVVSGNRDERTVRDCLRLNEWEAWGDGMGMIWGRSS